MGAVRVFYKSRVWLESVQGAPRPPRARSAKGVVFRMRMARAPNATLLFSSLLHNRDCAVILELSATFAIH